jgi:UDP-N-acetylglucosamine 2-epimerase (non-hydrolysing)
MPEELNRILVDVMATLRFAPTDGAVSNLLSEGISAGVIQTGDVMLDSLRLIEQQLSDTPPLVQKYGLTQHGFLVATIHRAATTDDAGRLARALDVLEATGLPVIFAIHPRTHDAIARAGLSVRLQASRAIIVVPPLGYAELLGLVRVARAVLTDSGGIQKQAYFLKTRCITMRDSTEWNETVASGWNFLVDLNPRAAMAALDAPEPADHPSFYGDGHAADRIVTALLDRSP